MHNRKKLFKTSTGFVLAAAASLSAFVPVVQVKAGNSVILINEVEADDPNDGPDWVEIINTGNETVDISGWYVTDDKGAERVDGNETTPFAEFSTGLLLGLSVGINLIGIILLVLFISKNDSHK